MTVPQCGAVGVDAMPGGWQGGVIGGNQALLAEGVPNRYGVAAGFQGRARHFALFDQGHSMAALAVLAQLAAIALADFGPAKVAHIAQIRRTGPDLLKVLFAEVAAGNGKRVTGPNVAGRGDGDRLLAGAAGGVMERPKGFSGGRVPGA